MKVLWLCNLVLRDFCEEFGFKPSCFGSWMTGMLHQAQRDKEVELALCFPIITPERAKDGMLHGCRYYSFPFREKEYDAVLEERLKTILQDFTPDIVHIWGTEYPHALAMARVCEQLEILKRVVVHFQGSTALYGMHFLSGVPQKYRCCKKDGLRSMEEEQALFIDRGKQEVDLLRKIENLIGRTEWDYAYAKRVNPHIHYHYCNEMLRDVFYQHIGEWSVLRCRKHSIFVSQASYSIKGFHFLLEALPDVIKENPDCYVFVAGHEPTGAYGNFISELIDHYKLSDYITFLGTLDEEQMCQRYLQSHVFVSASTLENSPSSISEAKLLGVPVVASYVGGVPSRVTSGYDAFLFQHNAPDMLAFYVNRLFEDTQLSEKISQNAAALETKLLNPQDIWKTNKMIYCNMLGNEDENGG